MVPPRNVHYNLNSVKQIQSVRRAGGFIPAQGTATGKILIGIASTILVGGIMATIAAPIVIATMNAHAQTTTTSSTSTITTLSTTTSTTMTTTSVTTTTTTSSSSTSTTTTTAPPSTICTSSSGNSNLYANQFIYNPTNRIYAAGMLNNQFGVYNAYGYGNVTSSALWTASQSSTPSGAFFAAQADRNLVVYASNSAVLWTANIFITGLSATFCLQMLDSGNLIWTNATGSIIWQTNTSG